MLIYDLAEPQELVGFVRAILDEEENRRFRLGTILPNFELEGLEFKVTQGDTGDMDAAFVRAWDVESPLGKRAANLSTLMGELAPISKKMRVGEEERLRRRALERGSNAELVARIYDDAGNLARAVAARIEMLRGEALWDGTLTINENGVMQTVDFGRSVSHEVVAGVLWTVFATSTPIQDYLSWVQTYVNTNGIAPAFALTSKQTVANMLLSTEVKNLVISTTGSVPAIIGRGTLDGLLTAFDLPPIRTYDVTTKVNGADVRVIPANRFILCPPADEPLGRTFWTATAEALELAEARQLGIDDIGGLCAVVWKNADPVSTWTNVSAISLPVLVNPNLTFVARVAA